MLDDSDDFYVVMIEMEGEVGWIWVSKPMFRVFGDGTLEIVTVFELLKFGS